MTETAVKYHANRLDDRQMGAVKSEADRILVTAVPGSGKTSTLVARLRHMVAVQRHSPSSIVAITFTRMAAKEIRARIGDAGRGMYIGTLHAFCLRLIMEMGGCIGYDPSWLSILDETDTDLDIKEVLADLGLVQKKRGGGVTWSKVKAGEWKGFLESVQAGDPPERDKVDPALWRAYDALIARFRAQNVLTYGTILTEAYRLLGDPKALEFFQGRYRHFLIDESQDTNHIQWKIVWPFVEKAHPDTVFVVGDADQSLYSWRGARPDIMVGMANDPRYEVHKLEYSYRFGPEIGDPANSLISHNTVRMDTRIVAKGGPSKPVRVVQDAQIAQVASSVQDALRSVSAREVAVLARTHRLLEEIGEALTELNVPHIRIGKLGAMRKTAEFRAIMGYLRLACNRNDRRAFMAITATEGLHEARIRDIRERAMHPGRSLLDEFEAERGPIPTDLDAIVEHIRVVDPGTDYEPAAQFLIRVAFYEGLADARAIVEYVSLADVQEEIMDAKDKDVVKLMTVHAAKGLEFPVVHIVGANQGIFPSSMAMKEGQLEEERRLFYVALTRTKRECTVWHLDNFRSPGISQFVEEMTCFLAFSGVKKIVKKMCFGV